MAMFAMLFTNSANTLMAITETNATLRAANIMMLFAVMHLLLAAVMVSAPFITNALVSNSSSVAGIVMPFVAAATAAGVATIKGSQASGTMPGSAVAGAASKVAGSVTSYRTPIARASSGVSSGSASTTNLSPSGQSVAPASLSANANAANTKTANAQRLQQRKGSLIAQQRKKNRSA